MIILDTHIWIWWINNRGQLTIPQQTLIKNYQSQGLGVSIISCWEVAKLVENGRIGFQCPVEEWLEKALVYPGVHLLELTPRIVVEATQLPGLFHRDPADQLIVATARVWNIPLFTLDEKILKYPHVTILK